MRKLVEKFSMTYDNDIIIMIIVTIIVMMITMVIIMMIMILIGKLNRTRRCATDSRHITQRGGMYWSNSSTQRTCSSGKDYFSDFLWSWF